ncbi:Dolichyl-diphosphooligosaccharide--protein glycosyltransferase subunit SWP1 [Candida viswanathii]|uniref:Dolichyl-diphosphooligosaccharide--protein glycosyltransferase subunit SWP1 n=1 Tax=Candida viswanathii TaxID=5486 RepID=A0A367Y753_9ASCO|nr:Dolichyl-diphosphooligosaccharide--protein glycosyltransferase subunit SWP1 [Candida viswanathii]
MKYSIFIALVNFIVLAFAYSDLTGTIKLNGKKITLGEINTQEVKQLSIESPKDVLEIKLKSKDIDGKPEQIWISLADAEDEGIISHYVPTVKQSDITATIKASTLPDVLKSKDKLILSIVIADSKSKDNLLRRLVEILPSPDFQATSKYQQKPRIGIQPEIHHIFRGDEQTVNPIIPVAFIGVATTLFLGLLGSWFGFIGTKNLFSTFKTITTTQLLYNVSFLVSLIGFELNFYKYYLGQSIFTTLFYGFILSVPCVYFGVSVLRYLAKNRALGKQ